MIGVGVKQSCSDLLIANCDEFIYYDDLVRERNGGRRESREAAPRRTPEEERNRGEKLEARKAKAVELAAATFADLIADRGDTERIWASVLKEVIKRRNPGFNETYFGFRSFGNLLEEAANRGLLGFGRDDKSGAYVTRVAPRPVPIDEGDSEAPDVSGEPVAVEVPGEAKTAVAGEIEKPATNGRRGGGRRSRKDRSPAESGSANEAVSVEMPAAVAVPVAAAGEEAQPAKPRRGGRRPKPEAVTASAESAVLAEAPVTAPDAGKPAAKRARTPRSRKPKAGTATAKE